jgi:transcriptional regulator with XRE-family HTH domain
VHSEENQQLLPGETFGQWVRRIRTSKRLRVVDCSREAGIEHTKWSRIESDLPKRKDGSPPVPTMETIEQITRGLEVYPLHVFIAAFPVLQTWGIALLHQHNLKNPRPKRKPAYHFCK